MFSDQRQTLEPTDRASRIGRAIGSGIVVLVYALILFPVVRSLLR